MSVSSFTQDKYILELGTYKGATAMIMGVAVKQSKNKVPIVTVDNGYSNLNPEDFIKQYGYSDYISCVQDDDIEYLSKTLLPSSVSMDLPYIMILKR